MKELYRIKGGNMQGKSFVTLVLIVFLLILWIHTQGVWGTAVYNNSNASKIDIFLGDLVEIKDSPVVEAKTSGYMNGKLMDCLWCIVGIVFGLPLGLYFGRLLTAIIAYWESAAAAVKWSTSIIGTVLGGAAFVLFSSHNADVFYVLGLGFGMLYSYFRPNMPPRYTLESVTHIVRMSEALRDNVPDLEQRVVLILTPLAPPKSIEREARMSEEELAGKLDQATDAFSSGAEEEQ